MTLEIFSNSMILWYYDLPPLEFQIILGPSSPFQATSHKYISIKLTIKQSFCGPGRKDNKTTYLFCFNQTDFNQCAAVMWHVTKVPQAQCHQLEGGRLGRGGCILCPFQRSFITLSFWKMRTEWAPHGNLLSFSNEFYWGNALDWPW